MSSQPRAACVDLVEIPQHRAIQGEIENVCSGVVAAGGMVVFGANDGNVYAVR
jgi:hypothetical protein